MSSTLASTHTSAPPAPPAAHLTKEQREQLLRDTAAHAAKPMPSPSLSSHPPPPSVSPVPSLTAHRLPKRDVAKPVAPANGSPIQAEIVLHTVEQPQTQPAPAPAHAPTASSSALTDSSSTSSSSSSSSSEASASAPASASTPSLSSQVRVATHQQPLLDALKELVRERGVGHWMGLSTEGRRSVATQLCRDHLFNPQPGNGSSTRTTVAWSASSSWTDFDVWVTCVRTVLPYYQGDVFTTTYSAHFDQVGRLVDFDVREAKSHKNCSIQ